MKRTILGFAFFALQVFAFAASAHAQATGADCSTANQPPKTWNQQPPDPICTGVSNFYPFSVYSTTVDSCINNNTGATYGPSPIVRQVKGTGYWHCFASGLGMPKSFKCNPIITQEVTHATSATDYNRFYLRDWDAQVTTANPCLNDANMDTQDFWQCQGVACPPPPPPSCSNPVGSAPYCGSESLVPQWNTSSCQWDCVSNPASSPILIDVSGNGFQLTGATGGVSYDIAGNGISVQMAWTAAGAQNAFLCLPDANGSCNSGKQLFGNFTPQPKSSTPNGFAALAVYDTPANGGNGDGVIDAHDAIFSVLRLWVDMNHDGISQPNELFTLPQLGITSISLNYKWDERTDQYGNVFRYRAQVGSASGAGRMAYDVFFVAQPNSTASTKSSSCPVPKTKTLSSSKAGGFSR